MIRLYPTKEQVDAMEAPQDALRLCWNWLCKQTNEVLEATRCHAVKEGLVRDPGYRTTKGLPCFPPIDYEGLTPDQSKEVKKIRSEEAKVWHSELYAATNATIQWRPRLRDMAKEYGLKQDYQMLIKRLDWEDEARAERGELPVVRPKQLAKSLEALINNFYRKSTGARRKKPRKSFEWMPLSVRSGTCLTLLGIVPTCSGVLVAPPVERTRRGNVFYNASILINGEKILGRLPGRIPQGRVLEGVSVTKQADGWWASVKVEVSNHRVQPENCNLCFTGKIVGIDVGLKHAIAAFDDGTLVKNARDSSFTDAIAKIQSEGDRGDEEAQRKANERVARMHQKQRKHMKHVIYNEVLKKCVDAEIIRIEKLSSKIGQMGTRHLSVMRLIRSMLVERYGERVQEIDPRYTSQVCSNCFQRDKEAWGHDDGPIKTCPSCGFRCHRDVNAAKNIKIGGVVINKRVSRTNKTSKQLSNAA